MDGTSYSLALTCYMASWLILFFSYFPQTRFLSPLPHLYTFAHTEPSSPRWGFRHVCNRCVVQAGCLAAWAWEADGLLSDVGSFTSMGSVFIHGLHPLLCLRHRKPTVKDVVVQDFSPVGVPWVYSQKPTLSGKGACTRNWGFTHDSVSIYSAHCLFEALEVPWHTQQALYFTV